MVSIRRIADITWSDLQAIRTGAGHAARLNNIYMHVIYKSYIRRLHVDEVCHFASSLNMFATFTITTKTTMEATSTVACHAVDWSQHAATQSLNGNHLQCHSSSKKVTGKHRFTHIKANTDRANLSSNVINLLIYATQSHCLDNCKQ